MVWCGRSSFIGHLSGIVLGYPLAWGWLHWLTPPVLTALLGLAVLQRDRVLRPDSYPGATSASSASELGPGTSESDSARLTGLKQAGAFVAGSYLMCLYQFGAVAFCPRAAAIYMIHCCVQARR